MTGDETSTRTALVVGGFGALGAAVATTLESDGCTVLRSSRAPRSGGVVLDDAGVAALPVLDAVVWAHGVNVNDRADDHDSMDLARILDVNVSVIAAQLQAMATSGRLAAGARVVIISSIWQDLARAGKFSYTVSKAAVGGLVRAAALDLAPRGILVNGVLPGVVDTPMTRQMLSAEQIATVEDATPGGRMVTPQDVAAVVGFLVSVRNTGLSGQSVVVDLGYSVGRSL